MTLRMSAFPHPTRPPRGGRPAQTSFKRSWPAHTPHILHDLVYIVINFFTCLQ